MATKGQLKFLTALSSLSKEDRFCDVRMELSDGHRDCNRLLLAAVSPFFNVMLSTDMLEGLSGLVKLPTVSTAIFDAILDYYVDGKGDLQDSAFYEAVNASEMMQLPEFKDVCLKNMEENLSPKTCSRAWQISRKFAAKDSVISKAFEMVLDNFELVSKQDDFLDLTRRDLTAILKHKGPKRPQEDHILEAVLRWIESNEPTEDEAQDLVSRVRLGCLTPMWIIKQVCRFKLVPKYRAIIEMMSQAANSDRLSCEHAIATKEVVIVASSSYGKRMEIHAFDPELSRWYCLSRDMDIKLQYFAAAAADLKIIVSGGLATGKHYSNCKSIDTYIYNTVTQVWNQGPRLNHARSHHSSVSINNVAYVLGGGFGPDTLDTVEELSPRQQNWRVAGNLCKPTTNAAVCTSGKYILIFGNTSTTGKYSIFEIQYFNVDNNTSCVLQASNELDQLVDHNTFARYCYMSYSSSLSVPREDDEEEPSLVVNKEVLSLPSGISSYSSNIGVVALNGRILVFTNKHTKEILTEIRETAYIREAIHTLSQIQNRSVVSGLWGALTGRVATYSGETIIKTLPKIPTSVSDVWGAVRGRVATKCLHSQ